MNRYTASTGLTNSSAYSDVASCVISKVSYVLYLRNYLFP